MKTSIEDGGVVKCPFNGCKKSGYPIKSCQFLRDAKIKYEGCRENEYRKCLHGDNGKHYFLKYKKPKITNHEN